jgi:mannosyl-glycoprotein endo-beta-N-acetylglucosaminidase
MAGPAERVQSAVLHSVNRVLYQLHRELLPLPALSSPAHVSHPQWPSTFPNLTAQYLLSLPPSLSLPHPKTLRDIFVGIDVWGRGSHGGGGLGAFRALSHIAPQELGLSVALFGPGWTWESNQDTSGWNWDVWWARERCLWLGPSLPGEIIVLPEMKRRPNEPPCEHGAFEPLTNSFTRRPAPDPRAVRFCTTFSPGSGTGWFVRGKRVLAPIAGPATGPAPVGWTDVDKQTSLGDALWPRPAVAWEGDAPPNVPLPRAEVELRFDDAWLGGSSVRLAIDSPGAEDEDAAFRCVWVPVQAVRATRGTAYVASLTYKLGDAPGADGDVDVDVALGVKMGGVPVDVEPMAGEEHAGWTTLRVRLTPRSSAPADADADAPAPALELGLIIAAVLSSDTSPLALDIRLGQLALHPRNRKRRASACLSRAAGIPHPRLSRDTNILVQSLLFFPLMFHAERAPSHRRAAEFCFCLRACRAVRVAVPARKVASSPHVHGHALTHK